MRSLESAVRASIREATRSGGPGYWAALAAGIAVAAPVARVFLGTGSTSVETLTMTSILAAIAFACTTAGAVLAIRARTNAKAIAWVFASNVIPPTVVCAPSVIGLIFSVPAGLLAAIVVLPLVLSVREWASEERAGRRERERLFGAGLLAFSALALLGYECFSDEVPYAGPHGSGLALIEAPAVVAALAALVFAGVSLVREIHLAYLAHRVRSGEVGGLRMAHAAPDHVTIEAVAETGAGPHRTAPTREALGDLPRSFARLLVSITFVVAAALALSAWDSVHAMRMARYCETYHLQCIS